MNCSSHIVKKSCKEKEGYHTQLPPAEVTVKAEPFIGLSHALENDKRVDGTLDNGSWAS